MKTGRLPKSRGRTHYQDEVLGKDGYPRSKTSAATVSNQLYSVLTGINQSVATSFQSGDPPNINYIPSKEFNFPKPHER